MTYKEFGTDLREVLREFGFINERDLLNRGELQNLLFERFRKDKILSRYAAEWTLGGINNYLSKLFREGMYGSSSISARHDINLRRLSITLHVIGLDKSHPFIGKVKAKDPRFHYPPDEPTLEEKVEALDESNKERILAEINQLYQQKMNTN
ncbi:MAG: hypothetical protein AABW87_01870 [Nanoarchaeota archaeon]